MWVSLLFTALLALSVSGKHHRFVTLQVSKPSFGNGAVAGEESELLRHPDTFGAHLFHRDSPRSPVRPTNVSRAALLRHRFRHDELRVKAIAAKISLATSGFNASVLEDVESSKLESPLISGFASGSGDYFARIGVGSPARAMYMVADTGSDITWFQCAPCTQCYKQMDPLFNPARSSSFKKVSCHSPICDKLKARGCSRSSNSCRYQVSYGDGSFTVGDLSTETLHFGKHTVRNVAVGCGRNNQGLFHGAAGLLGLGRGSLSFPSQAKTMFSYCLPSRDSNFTTPLMFGPGSVPKSAKFTKLVPNKFLGSYYYVALSGIRVGGSPLKLPEDVFVVDSSGTGGVIIDSGTAITRLATPVYNVLRDRFKALVNFPEADTTGFPLFDTCYDLSGFTSVKLPDLALEFEGGAEMLLPADGILVEVDDRKTYCLAFAPEEQGFSIIGNAQQQTFRISIDDKKKVMGITPDQCK